MWSWDAGVQQPLLMAADTSAGALRAAFPVLLSHIQPPVTCAAVGCSGPSTEPHSRARCLLSRWAARRPGWASFTRPRGAPVAQAAVVQLPNAGPGPKGLRQDVRVLSTCPASPGAQHSAALACWPGLRVVSQPRPAFIYAARHSPFQNAECQGPEGFLLPRQ